MAKSNLERIVGLLQTHYGPPAVPTVTDPFQMILHENAAYLVDDERRERVWKELKRRIGIRPQEILDADAAALVDAIRDGGMQPDHRAEKLRKSAEIAVVEFDGDLKKLIAGPIDRACRGLKKFPGVGEPGAEKILLFARKQAVLALESNGLRVLLRLGYGKETKDYSKTYRSVQSDLAAEMRDDFDWLIAAHQLLRQHGKTLCKRTDPMCAKCPLASLCPSAKRLMS